MKEEYKPWWWNVFEMSCDLQNIFLERRGMLNPWNCTIPKVPHAGLGAGCGYHSPAGLTYASGKGSKLLHLWCPCFCWHILDCLMLVILFSFWSLLFLGTNHSFFSYSAMLTTKVGKINHPKSCKPEMPGDFSCYLSSKRSLASQNVLTSSSASHFS